MAIYVRTPEGNVLSWFDLQIIKFREEFRIAMSNNSIDKLVDSVNLNTEKKENIDIM